MTCDRCPQCQSIICCILCIRRLLRERYEIFSTDPLSDFLNSSSSYSFNEVNHLEISDSEVDNLLKQLNEDISRIQKISTIDRDKAQEYFHKLLRFHLTSTEDLPEEAKQAFISIEEIISS